ncbi:MAG: DUF4013 domain-containing protein [Halovenus sp.]
MFKEAILVPLEGERWLGRLLIGGGLLFISFGIVPLWILFGYLVRFIEAVLEEDKEFPPSFDYWGLLMHRGGKAFAIFVVYVFVPTVLALIGGAYLFFAPVNDSITPAQARPPLTAAAVLYPVTLYAFPAALLEFARHDRVRAGFSPRRLGRHWFSWKYAWYWLLAVVAVLTIHALAVLVALTAIGVVAIPSILFYSYLVGTYLLTTGTRAQFDVGGATS